MFFICNFSGHDRQLRADHDAAQYRIVDTDGTLVCALQKRQAYPVTYCIESNDGFELGYGAINESDFANEYLKVFVSARKLVISRDALATLPLFYSQNSDGAYVSNDYASLFRTVQAPEIDSAALAEVLAVDDLQLGRSPLVNIRSLQERETLEYDFVAGLQLTYPPNRDWTVSGQVHASDPKAFRERFDESLDGFLQSRLVGQQVAFQVSGGLDSSALPLYMASRHGMRSMVVGSVLLPGQAGQSQAVKLDALYERLQPSQILHTDMSLAQDYPLSTMIPSGRYCPFFTEDAVCYESSLNRHAASLQAAGVNVLATGLGGDDIVENVTNGGQHYAFGAAERRRRQQTLLAPYLTDSFQNAYAAAVPIATGGRRIPMLPLSTIAASYINNTYIERGIWPASPYLNYDLYRFCQGLPAYLRANKNMMRAYFQASCFPAEIYNPGKGESLQDALTQFFCSDMFTQAIEQSLKESITVQLGWVNKTKLRSALYHEQGRQNDNQWLFAIYQWLCAEINLQGSLTKN